MNMNYEGMSTPQSTLCSRTGMFECLTVTHKIHLFLFISGRLLASTLSTDQPMRQASYGDSPPTWVCLGIPGVPFVSKLRIPFPAIHPGHSGSLLVPFWVPFKRLVFLCFQIICVSPSFNPHFSKGSHSGQQLLSEKLGHYSGKEKKTEMMYARNDMKQLCVAKWFKKKMEETSAREEELNLHRHWEYDTTIWGQ